MWYDIGMIFPKKVTSMKKTLTSRQMADYEKLCTARVNGQLLTPDGLRAICAAYDYDPSAIGQHFLNVLPQICPGSLSDDFEGFDATCPYRPD